MEAILSNKLFLLQKMADFVEIIKENIQRYKTNYQKPLNSF